MLKKKNILLVGGIITTVIGVLTTGTGFVLYLLDHHIHIKVKMFTFMILPNVIMAGLTLIVIHLLLKAWLKKRNGVPIIDKEALVRKILGITRAQALGALIIGSVAAASSGFFGFSAYHFTESREFCGQMCHEPMGAQYVAFQDSPHASIRCVDCHVGPTMVHFAQAKISGMHQVNQVMTNNFPRPIYAPLAKLPAADLTCKNCHWQDMNWGDYMNKQTRYSYDFTNSKRYVQVQIHAGGITHTGGGVPGGVHHHMMTSDVRFYSKGDRHEEIGYMKITKPDGRIVHYDLFDKGEKKYSDSELDAFNEVKVDCLSCHNRPAHRFESPDSAVDNAFERGKLDRSLPCTKKVAMEALRTEYKSKDEAMAGIETHVKGFYKRHFGDEMVANRKDSIENNIKELKAIYNRNVFPHMNLQWNQYESNIGHRNSEGCLKCHNRNYVNRETGEAINYDCQGCHTFFKQSRSKRTLEEVSNSNDLVHPFRHNTKMKTHLNCWDCHDTRNPYTSCVECHDKATAAPVMRFECSICHKPGQEKVTNKNCQACHPGGKSELHLAPENADCQKCHKPHLWKIGTDRTFCPQCRKTPGTTGEGCDYCAKFKGMDSLMHGLKVFEPLVISTSKYKKSTIKAIPADDDTGDPKEEPEAEEPKAEEH